MIGVTTENGRVLIFADVETSSLAWSPEKCAKLIRLIETYIEGVELFEKFGLEGKAVSDGPKSNVK